MGFIMQKILSVLILFFSTFSFGQSLEIQSLYPESAFIVKRLLPFSIGGDDKVKIVKIDIINGGSCKSMMDPFYGSIFHVYCRNPENFGLQVIVFDSRGNGQTLAVEGVSVVVQREPLPAAGQVDREPSGGGG